MSQDKIFHRADEFHKFPWDKLEYGKFKTNGENYNFGKGGPHYVNGIGWQITIYSGKHDLHSETWELPKALSDMLDYQEQYGEEQNKRKTKIAFRDVLKIIGIK